MPSFSFPEATLRSRAVALVPVLVFYSTSIARFTLPVSTLRALTVLV